MPPVTTTIPGATVVFCALNAATATSFYGNPTANTIQYTVVSTIDFTQSFTFTSNGVSYTSLHLVGSTTDPTLRKMYYIADGVETLVYHNDQWTDESYKTITFETQNVREGIYGLLYGSANHVNCGCKIPAGTYRWIEDVVKDGSLFISSFTSGNEVFCVATGSTDGRRYYKKFPANNSYESVYIYTDGAWVDEKYKTITIPENCYIEYGDADVFTSLFESTPTISFKHRFKNDTLIGTGTYKFRRYSVEEPVATYTLEAGTYKWVDTLSVPYEPPFYYKFAFNFVSNNVNYTYIQLGSELDALLMYENNRVYGKNTWFDDNYKTITLSTSQTVSAEFYNWAITGGNLVKQTGETWMLNSDLSSAANLGRTVIDFVSNGASFKSLSYNISGEPNSLYYFEAATGTTSTLAYVFGTWQNTAYRTITFSTPPTGNLLTWLQANGTKQGGVTTKKFTLPTYSGMTGVADGYQLLSGDIDVSESVYNALTAVNAGGSLTDFGNTCGLTIPASQVKMDAVGYCLKATDSAEVVNGKYVAVISIDNLTSETQANPHVIEFDYETNTATYTALKADDVDVENHSITVTGIKANGKTLLVYCFDVVTPKGYKVSYTNTANSTARCEVKINGSSTWTTITESSGSFDNVESIQFYLGYNPGMYSCSVVSTTLGVNLDSRSAAVTSDVYTVTQDVSDLKITWQPAM